MSFKLTHIFYSADDILFKLSVKFFKTTAASDMKKESFVFEIPENKNIEVTKTNSKTAFS